MLIWWNKTRPGLNVCKFGVTKGHWRLLERANRGLHFNANEGSGVSGQYSRGHLLWESFLCGYVYQYNSHIGLSQGHWQCHCVWCLPLPPWSTCVLSLPCTPPPEAVGLTGRAEAICTCELRRKASGLLARFGHPPTWDTVLSRKAGSHRDGHVGACAPPGACGPRAGCDRLLEDGCHNNGRCPCLAKLAQWRAARIWDDRKK